MDPRRTRARLVAGAAAGAATLLMLGSPALADPAGNNGTVKIDGQPFDTAPDNQAHVGCVFQVDFYGFDAGPGYTAEVQFAVQPPTGSQVILTDQVPIGEDSHAGGGSEAGLDAQRTYDLTSELSGFTPQAKQGYHVKLTIHADGTQGADVKHKVFWVQCAGQGPSTSAAAAPAPQAAGAAAQAKGSGAGAGPAGDRRVTAAAAGLEAPVAPAAPVATAPASTPAAIGAEVLAAAVTQRAAAGAEVRPAQTHVLAAELTRPAGERGALPRTGADVAGAVALGTALLGLGAGAVGGARRLRRP